MKILSDKNVFDAALERINFLFDEFPNIVVGMSGAKDSTAVYTDVWQAIHSEGWPYNRI
jgi:predicted phosphoadenosine phosphosulfate sulfurtransferase